VNMVRITWKVLLLLAVVARDAEADEWWGRDKAMHFGASVGISAGVYTLMVPVTANRDVRALAGGGTSLLIGAAKEGYDALGYGDPSWRDFAWDIAGTAVGIAVAYAVDCLLEEPRDKAADTATTRAPLMLSF